MNVPEVRANTGAKVAGEGTAELSIDALGTGTSLNHAGQGHLRVLQVHVATARVQKGHALLSPNGGPEFANVDVASLGSSHKAAERPETVRLANFIPQGVGNVRLSRELFSCREVTPSPQKRRQRF
jgi:hypothetical protein